MIKYTENKLYERARCSYYDQLKRCNNPKNKLYKWYGEKGISVKYDLISFLNWYYENAKDFQRPTVDRINHEKDYCFSNIQIVEKSENSKERIRRLGTPIPRRKVLMFDKNGNVTEFESCYHAASFVNGNPSNVSHVCHGKRLSHKGFFFKFKE